MKVVLIAESEDTISEYSAFLEEAGADVITYRWFLKALDNLTEIQPHIIIVSAQDFPRHWKTLFTHIEAGEVKTRPLVYLITDPSFTASEKKKAMFLGAQDIFYSPLTNRDKNSLLSMLPAGMGIEPPAPKAQEQLPERDVEVSSQEAVPSPEVTDSPVSENSEYAELQKQAESNAIAENRIHNISAAEANAFDLIDSEISNLDNEDEGIQEVTSDSQDDSDSLVVDSAEEDILTKLEDEMTESDSEEPVAEEPQVEFNEPEQIEETPVQERPEQITWSAPVDEYVEAAVQDDETVNDDPIQFSFINPRTGMFVTGKVVAYDHPTVKFEPSSTESAEGIRFGQIIDQCKFTFEGETVRARAQVRGLGQAIEFCLLY